MRGSSVYRAVRPDNSASSNYEGDCPMGRAESLRRLLVVLLLAAVVTAVFPLAQARSARLAPLASEEAQSAGSRSVAGPNALGWVGNMFPAGGSSNSITAGASFDVYIQVWKDGTTNALGQGANITCTLYWGQVATFGGVWSSITSTPMSYHGDVGNNDEYKGTISPPPGLYEFTAYCTDTTDNQSLWQQNGNGRLTVSASSGDITPCSTIPTARWPQRLKPRRAASPPLLPPAM